MTKILHTAIVAQTYILGPAIHQGFDRVKSMTVDPEVRPKQIDISIVVPVYDEVETLTQLYLQICQALQPVGRSFEIVFVDDGSSDGSYEAIMQLPQSDADIQAIQLRRNFGKSTALAAGFDMARGEVIVTIDADLQDNPQDIPRILEKLDQGNDLVTGWKVKRRDSFEKRLASKIFNRVASYAAGVRLHDANCGLKAYRRQLIETIPLYGQLHRYIPLVAANLGFRVAELPVDHSPRMHGDSKYGWERYFEGFFDLITVHFLTRYNQRPLHFLGKIALVLLLIGALLIAYVMLRKFGFGETGVRPSLTASVFFLGTGLQVFLFGLLAELMTHNYQANQFNITKFEKTRFFRDRAAENIIADL